MLSSLPLGTGLKNTALQFKKLSYSRAKTENQKEGANHISNIISLVALTICCYASLHIDERFTALSPLSLAGSAI